MSALRQSTSRRVWRNHVPVFTFTWASPVSKVRAGRREQQPLARHHPIMLPLGVVIPVKNSRPALPDHVAGLREWLAEAEQVVVVDSESTDGTVEYLREHLQHPRLTFTSHPPGLYASWNHGIAQIQSRYVYLATAGDTITRKGLGRLVETA